MRVGAGKGGPCHRSRVALARSLGRVESVLSPATNSQAAGCSRRIFVVIKKNSKLVFSFFFLSIFYLVLTPQENKQKKNLRSSGVSENQNNTTTGKLSVRKSRLKLQCYGNATRFMPQCVSAFANFFVMFFLGDHPFTKPKPRSAPQPRAYTLTAEP